MSDFAAARALLGDAVVARAFPSAVVEVGARRGVSWREAFGTLSWDPGAPAAREDTIFDLASLTKVIATTSLVMRLVEAGRLALEDHVRRWLPEWTGEDREAVTVANLLGHDSGLTAWLPFFRDHHGRREFQRAICSLPLEYRPGTQSIYSDLGFMLLGFIVEDACGAPLATAFAEMSAGIIGTGTPLTFCPPGSWRARTAPTEIDPWRGRLLVGEVHDENAWALGGAAGHAGLFGSAAAVGQFARAVLSSLPGGTVADSRAIARPDTMPQFLTRTATPGSSRALGWDTMLPASSCGTRMTPSAFGHTGFTGTSLWIDPEPGVYIVLLTNRVHPTRANDAIRTVRPAVHDAIMEVLLGVAE